MSIEIDSKDVDVRKIMSEIRERIEEKKRGLYTDEEIREIAERKLEAVLESRQFNPDFLREFKTKSAVWAADTSGMCKIARLQRILMAKRFFIDV